MVGSLRKHSLDEAATANGEIERQEFLGELVFAGQRRARLIAAYVSAECLERAFSVLERLFRKRVNKKFPRNLLLEKRHSDPPRTC